MIFGGESSAERVRDLLGETRRPATRRREKSVLCLWSPHVLKRGSKGAARPAVSCDHGAICGGKTGSWNRRASGPQLGREPH
jgi:hypothetical protein